MLYAFIDTASYGSNAATAATTTCGDWWSAYGNHVVVIDYPYESGFKLDAPIKPCPLWKITKAASGPGPPPAKVKRLRPFRRIVEPQPRLIE